MCKKQKTGEKERRKNKKETTNQSVNQIDTKKFKTIEKTTKSLIEQSEKHEKEEKSKRAVVVFFLSGFSFRKRKKEERQKKIWSHPDSN